MQGYCLVQNRAGELFLAPQKYTSSKYYWSEGVNIFFYDLYVTHAIEKLLLHHNQRYQESWKSEIPDF